MHSTRILVLIALCLVNCATTVTFWCPRCVYVGSIQFPKTITQRPQLVGYYKGTKINISEGAFELVDVTTDRELYVLVTLGPVLPCSACTEEPNTIRNFELTPGTSYSCYKIRQNLYYRPPIKGQPAYLNEDQKPWFIEQIKLTATAQRLEVPDNTLIILMNPSLVAQMNSQPWSCTGTACKLPTLVLKESATPKALAAMNTKAQMAALDLDPFHRKPVITTTYKEQFPKLVVAMATN